MIGLNLTLMHAVKLLELSEHDTNFTHILEFGVYNGHTTYQLRNTLHPKYEVFGFDTFTGLPEDWVGTGIMKGTFNVEGKVPIQDGVKFYKGLFSDTIHLYKEIAKPIALLHVDCDLYSSTKDIFDNLSDFILPGTVIVFDEWYYNMVDIPVNRQHEQKAFYEWVTYHNRSFELYPEIERERRIVKILK